MSNVTRRALEAYRAQLVTEFSASITALDAALAHLEPSVVATGFLDKAAENPLPTAPVAEPYLPSPVAPPMPYVNPHIPASEPVVVQQTFTDGGYVDTPVEQPVAPLVPAEPWVVNGPPTAAPAEKKGRRTNEEIAAEYGVDLKDVVGTGKNGRITHDDIKTAGEVKAAAAAAPVEQAPAEQVQQAPQPAEQPVQQFQPTPEQFAAFQAAAQQIPVQLPVQQAGQPYAQPQLQQQAPAQQQVPQFVPPQMAVQPPPALPEGFAPATFQQAY